MKERNERERREIEKKEKEKKGGQKRLRKRNGDVEEEREER